MTIKTYWALSVEESAKHEHAVAAQNKAQADAVNYIKERIPCDSVFFTIHGCAYLGFKSYDKPTHDKLRKTVMERHDGYWLCSPKSKTDWSDIVSEGRKIANSAVKFQDYCKQLWPQTKREVIGTGNSPSSFSLSKTAFGFLKGQLVMCLPVSDSEKLDKSIIPEGFTELTMSQYSELASD